MSLELSESEDSFSLPRELTELSMLGPILDKLPDNLMLFSLEPASFFCSIFLIIGTKIGGYLINSLLEVFDDEVFCELSVSFELVLINFLFVKRGTLVVILA